MIFLMHHRLAAALTRTSSVAHSPHRHAAIDMSDGNTTLISNAFVAITSHKAEASAPSLAI